MAKKTAKRKAAKKKAAKKKPARKKSAAKKAAAGRKSAGSKSAKSKAALGSRDDLLHYLAQMCRIRFFEEKVFELLAQDLIKGASHVYAGEEAVAVGACAGINHDDYITSTHRGHGHCLAKGGQLRPMMAELCGKETGYCRGRGGSMHIADVAEFNLGATGIVGSNIPVATGAALAQKMQGTGRIVVCFFGDGASNNAAFTESLNVASVWKLPVVYLCENNLYGMSVSVERASATKDIADKAKGYNVPSEIVDGQMVLTVRDAVRAAAERARAGEGPQLIEAKTYRYYGHSRSDPRKYRTKEEEAYWRGRDPIKLFEQVLLENGIATQKELERIEEQCQAEVDDAADFAVNSPDPDPATLLEGIYA